MQEYKITAVQRKDEWQSTFGPMVSYDLALEGEEGWVRINQKPETPPPREGETVTGNIKVVNLRDGESFRKIQKVNPQYAGQDSQPRQQQSLAGSQEGYIVQMLEELTGRRPAHEGDVKLEDPFPNL